MKKTANSIQVLPLPKVDARYGPTGGKYPERVRIAMADGTTHWYTKEIKQPGPVFREKLDEFTHLCVGYERNENND